MLEGDLLVTSTMGMLLFIFTLVQPHKKAMIRKKRMRFAIVHTLKKLIGKAEHELHAFIVGSVVVFYIMEFAVIPRVGIDFLIYRVQDIFGKSPGYEMFAQ